MWALSHLPVEDWECWLKHLEQKYEFQDKKVLDFKFYMCKYITAYWFYWVYTPKVLTSLGCNCDINNNNKEGYNSKINGSIKQEHPITGILLFITIEQIKKAEGDLAKVKAGIPKPRETRKYKLLAR